MNPVGHDCRGVWTDHANPHLGFGQSADRCRIGGFNDGYGHDVVLCQYTAPRIGKVIATLERQQSIPCEVGGFDASTSGELVILAHHAYCTSLVEHLSLEFIA